MALYRGDPVLESLRDVGNSLRSASGDVLQRRRLDIEEQGLLGKQEQERNLQQLRTQTAEAAGQTELLKAKGGVYETQERLRLAGLQEARAAEKQPYEIGHLQAGTAQIKAATQETQQLLPGKIREQADRGTLMRAQAAHAAASTETERLKSRLTAAELTNATREIPVEPLNAFLTDNNPMLAQLFQHIHKPGATTNMLELNSLQTIMKNFYPGGYTEAEVAGYDQKLQRPDLTLEDRQATETARRDALTRMGRTPRDNHQEIEAMITSNLRAMKGTNDPATRQKLAQQTQEYISVLGAMRNKGGQLASNSAEFFANSKLKMDEVNNLRAEELASKGRDVGDLDDFLMDKGLEKQPANYMTPNEFYDEAAHLVKPASPDELRKYQQGGTLMDGTVVPAHPEIKTQADADTFKRTMFVKEKHKQVGGDRKTLQGLIREGAIPVTQGPPAPPAAAPTAPAPTSPFAGRAAQLQQEVVAQLRQTLGREPTPEEVQARMQELRSPGFVPGGGPSLLGAARKFMQEQNITPALTPEDRLRRLQEHQQRTGIPPTGANELQDR